VREAALLILAAAVALSGCGNSSDIVVAKVGDEKITIGDLEEAVRKIPKAYSPKGEDEEQVKRGYLQTLIDKELLLIEARSRGYDRDLADKVARKRSRLMEKELYRREVQSKVNSKVTKEDVLNFFKGSNYSKKVRISIIVLNTKDEADRAMERLSKGEKFEDVAKEMSTHVSRERGGDIGWQYWQRGLRSYQMEAFRSNVGRIIGPVRTRANYQIIKVTDVADVDFDELDLETKKEVKEECYRQRLLKRQKKYIDHLRKKRHLKFNTDAVFLILSKVKARGELSAEDFSDEEKDLVLLTYDGGSATVGDYLDFLSQRKFQAPRDSARVVGSLNYFSDLGILVPAEAERMRLGEKEPVKSEVAKFEGEQISEKLRQVEAVDKVKITDDMVRDYFDRNRKFFRVLAAFRIQEILVRTKEEADSLKKLIENGADMGKLAEKHTIRPGIPRQNRGIVVFNPGNREFGELTEAAERAKLNELVGPVKVSKGYSIFRVLEKRKERYQSFDEVKKKAANYLKMELINKNFDNLLKELREKYADIVTVYDGALKYCDLKTELQGPVNMGGEQHGRDL